MALKAQFENFDYKVHQYSFTRTENQIIQILNNAKETNSVVLYTIVNSQLAKFLTKETELRQIPCFGVLGELILNFSKILNKKSLHIPSGQHVLDEEYYQGK